MRVRGNRIVLAIGLLAGCTPALDPTPKVVHARFDPDEKVIPMPTNVLRDDAAGKLDVPLDGKITEAEREFFTWLNTLEGWSSAMSATVEFTAPVAPATLNDKTVQVWQAGTTPKRVDGVTMTLDPDKLKLTIDPPRTGWERGETYFVLVRGGASGVEGKLGEPVECDAAFYFLRQTQKLDVPAHELAFPGKTRAERMDNARKLEEIRVELTPYFEHFARAGIPRKEVAALWSFTVTKRVELAMDKASQRMPLPMNLLLDPTTGKVDLPDASWDSKVVLDAKHKLRELDGFALSANLLFEFTGPVDPTTVTPASVELYELPETGAPRKLEATVRMLADRTHGVIEPIRAPLGEKTRYGVLVHRSLRDADGQPLVAMPVGHFVRASLPVFENGRSLIKAVADADAERLERVRKEVRPWLDAMPALREDTLAAWTFTTMTVTPQLMEAVSSAERIGVSPDPKGVVHMTPLQALSDFALAISSLLYVGDVYTGTIQSPVYLDKKTRGNREDGGYEVQDIHFTLTMPRGATAAKPVPVVIFGHAIMTERRFVLAVGDALAQRGYAAISIDFPFHGERTYCWSEGPLTVPDPRTGKLTGLDPCNAGSRCLEDGRCVNASGGGNDLAKWPVIGMYSASGAAFIEVEHISNTRDHFRQAVIDLGALSRSLRKGNWAPALGGVSFDTRELYYAGQSLGGIIGATYVALSPEIKRAVLNVPGADTVDLFADSPFFSGHINAFFTREGVTKESFEGERFLNVARWFMDATDPASVASHLKEGRQVMLQMATLDAIIPNKYTQKLADLAGLTHRDYVAEHAFLVIPIEPEYGRGTRDLGDFIKAVGP